MSLTSPPTRIIINLHDLSQRKDIKMNKKTLTLLSLALFVAIFLCSCSFMQGDQTPSGNNPSADTPGGDTPAEENVKLTQLVLESLDFDVFDLRADIFDVIGMIPTVNDTEAPHKGEIVIGNTSRPISAAAKAELDNLIADSGKVGYIIYYDGKSVSVYWQNDQLMDLAIAKFNTLCVNTHKLVLKKGIIDSAMFSPADLARDAKWLAIEATASPEVYQALRSWYNNFNGTYTVGWLANLYDPEIGGFYYSNSARDNEPFRPDLESTYQALSILSSWGAINHNSLPNDMKAAIVSFAKSTQSSTDGYFCHEQWGPREQLAVDRYGRDLTWATWLINNIKVDTDGDGVAEKQYPNWCAPSGLKCEEHANNGGACTTVTAAVSYKAESTVSLTSVLTRDVASAVSAVKNSAVSATASTPQLDLSSAEAFKSSLEIYDATIKIDSGKAHHINALQDDIRARGYIPILLDHIERAQAEVWAEQEAAGEGHSGAWQYTADYRLVWGIHKYNTFYNNDTYGRSMIYHEELVRSCMTVILSPADKSYAVNDIMNMWTAIRAIVNNAKTYAPEKVSTLNSMVSSAISELMAMTTEKLLQFRLDNGTFTTDTTLRSRSNLYGVSISLGAEEADVNANLLIGGLYDAPFSAMGYTKVPLCTSDDGDMFLEMIENLEPIDKTPLPERETVDFNGADIDNMLNSKYLTYSVNTPEFEVDIVTDDETGSDVLYFKSGIGSTTASNKADFIYLRASNSGGNCNVAEFDFRLMSVTKDSHIFQIKVGSGFQFMIYKSGQYLKISAINSENVALGSQVLVDTSAKLEAFDWHKIRIEVFDAPEGETDPIIKFYVNDTLYGTTRIYYGCKTGMTYNPGYANLAIYSCSPVETEVHIDNVYLSREYLELGEE